jgi:hypothetical protein
MSGEQLLLRRLIPLLAGLVLLAPATARASSFSPDPPPGSKANGLKPDPAPSAVPTPKPKPKVTTTVRRPTSPAPVVRPVVVPVVHTAPVVKQTPTVHRAKPKAKAAARPKPKPKPALVVPTLPRVLVPAFVEAPLSSDPPRALAALALALAALTALSGAGVVFSWSRR